MLPVGSDHVIPARWVTDVGREWAKRYVWPRFVPAVPREFFAAVRAASEASPSRYWIMPQTRDMNPVYTGKDVSYADTKLAARAGETAVLEGERLSTLAWLAGAAYPAESLDKAWRQLAYGAHHDAITGTESDQVYLDLLAGWREAWERGDAARRDAIAFLTETGDAGAPLPPRRRRAGGDGGERAGAAPGRDGDGHRRARRARHPLADSPRRGVRPSPPGAGRGDPVARRRVAGRGHADVPRGRPAAARVPAVPAARHPDADENGEPVARPDRRGHGRRSAAGTGGGDADGRNWPGSATGRKRTGSRSPTRRSP